MDFLTYRRDIQGLRAIAVLSVILFHYNPNWLPGGFIGVDIFFVISGFLIASILLNQKLSENYKFAPSLRGFYKSRIKRILPAYFVMLVAVSLLVAILFTSQDFSVYLEGLRQVTFFNSNYYFSEFGSYFAPENHEQPLLHTWSLAVEIQFYLVIPFLILILPNIWLKRVLWTLLILLTLIAEYRLRSQGAGQETYYSLYARLPEFFAGVLAANYVFERQLLANSFNESRQKDCLSVVCISLIIATAFLQPSYDNFPGVAALIPAFGVAILLMRPSGGVAGRLLSCGLLVRIGALSYSLYLWHWPVLAIIRYFTGLEELGFGYTCIFVSLTLLLSVFSYYLIENTFRGGGEEIVKTLIKWVLLIAGVIIAIQSLAKINRQATPAPLSVEYQRYSDPKIICHSKIVGDCFRGDMTSELEILVVGDSHAAMLNHFFDDLGKQLGFKARVITASSCLTISDFDVDFIAEWARPDCIKQIHEAMKYIESHEYIALAGMWSYQLTSVKNRSAISSFFLKNNHKKILVFKQVPELINSPMRVIRFRHIGLSVKHQPDKEWGKFNSLIEQLVAQQGDVEFVNAEEYIQGENLPYFGGELIYFDESHLNEVGSTVYAKAVKDQISGWLGK